MAGHLARNQVHAGSIPAAQTVAWGCRPTGGRGVRIAEMRVRFPPSPLLRSFARRALPNGRQPVPKTGVVVMSPRGSIPPFSSTAPWSTRRMTAPSQGAEPGSTPGGVTMSHWSTRRWMRAFQARGRGSTPRWDTRMPTWSKGGAPRYERGLMQVRVLPWVHIEVKNGDVLEW